MADRQFTNLLLLIIVAVLLFGSSAVTGVLQWVALIVGAIVLVYLLLAVAGYAIAEAAKAIMDAKQKGVDVLIGVTFGIILLTILIFISIYTVFLWFIGTPRPMTAAMDSILGLAWIYALFVGFIALIIWFLVKNRNYIIPTILYTAWLLVRSPLAPFFLGVYAWRKARTAGDGMASSTVSAFWGVFSGLIVWSIMFTIIANVIQAVFHSSPT